MGLACSNIRLLTLTARKADCEYGISIDSMRKMALSREQSNLSKEYYSKLQAKSIAYYDNGKYNKINYSYLMGYGANYAAITNGSKPLKSENSMILTDYKGQVVMDDAYANALVAVLGSSAMDSNGRGGTFSTDKIPEILAKLVPGHTAEEFKAVMDGKQVAFLVPTTILAEQHYKNLKKRFSDFPVKIDMISRFRTAKQQKTTLQALKEGNVPFTPVRVRKLSELAPYHFHKFDPHRYPAPGIALGAYTAGGTATAVLNAANEEAVYAFLNGKIAFLEIEAFVKAALEAIPVDPHPSLRQIMAADSYARMFVKKKIERRTA